MIKIIYIIYFSFPYANYVEKKKKLQIDYIKHFKTAYIKINCASY